MRFLRRFLSKGHKGFTLVEVLIAVGVLAIATAVAVPATAKFNSSAKTKSAAAELANVQAALDAMMADKGLESVTAIVQGSATDAMGAFPSAANALNGVVASGDYLRQATTTHTYYVDADGSVSQVLSP